MRNISIKVQEKDVRPVIALLQAHRIDVIGTLKMTADEGTSDIWTYRTSAKCEEVEALIDRYFPGTYREVTVIRPKSECKPTL